MNTNEWQPLTVDVAKTLNGKKILLKASQQILWLTVHQKEDIYKIFVNPHNEEVYILKPKARSYCELLSSLINPQYKLIK